MDNENANKADIMNKFTALGTCTCGCKHVVLTFSAKEKNKVNPSTLGKRRRKEGPIAWFQNRSR